MSNVNKDTSQSDISKRKNEHGEDGSYKRVASSFRDVIDKGGKYEPESGRYHLYVSYACPWANRTLITRKIKGLESHIGVTVVSPRMGPLGWPFASVDEFPAAEKDPNENAEHVRDLYFTADPNYGGKFTVPVLWDKKTKKVVNNESSEIIRILNAAFNHLLPPEFAKVDIYPEKHRAEIDEINSWVYETVNNGVYRTGFATSPGAYQEACETLFASLDRLEKMLKGKDYLVGNELTEADIRLFVTIVRFDPVYFGHFKCNIRQIRHGYPELNRWMKKLYWTNDAFKSTTNFEHIKTHYYWSHPQINPTRIVPIGPEPNIEPL